MDRLPDVAIELDIFAMNSQSVVAGVDEVGRGCLFGPVVVCAAIIPFQDKHFLNEAKKLRINDSKKVLPKKREEISQFLKSYPIFYKIGESSVAEIDEINIYYATKKAIEKAVMGLDPAPDQVLIDGNFNAFTLFQEKGIEVKTIVKGDMKVLSIACASILAKVYRDELMTQLDLIYPHYGISGHKGYATEFHRESIKKFGLTSQHRKSFCREYSTLRGGDVETNFRET